MFEDNICHKSAKHLHLDYVKTTYDSNKLIKQWRQRYKKTFFRKRNINSQQIWNDFQDHY